MGSPHSLPACSCHQLAPNRTQSAGFTDAGPLSQGNSLPIHKRTNIHARCNLFSGSGQFMKAESPCRGLTAALLGQPAAGIEIRHPYMTGASKAALRPLLGVPPISSRIHEVSNILEALSVTVPTCMFPVRLKHATTHNRCPAGAASSACCRSRQITIVFEIRHNCCPAGVASMACGGSYQTTAVLELTSRCSHPSCGS